MVAMGQPRAEVTEARPQPRDGAAAVSVTGLVKTFGATRALDGLELSVAPGTVHGFLGPNGSGKSTTLRILLGMLRADAGTLRLLGGDPWKDAVALHRRLAYVPGEVALWPNLSGGEAIDLFAALRGTRGSRRAELIERFHLDPTKRCGSYSKGNRQKVALIAAFASDVELFLLDEPTAGLDPLMEAEFQELVRERSAAGSTVLLSSHILAEVEALCGEVTIIREGRTVESGTLSELRHLTRTSITVQTRTPLPGLASLPGVHDLVWNGDHTAHFDVDNAALGEVHRALAEAGVVALTSTPPTLEELFLRHYEHDDEPSAVEGAPA
jgi:ABC-2 type transport system ATP-binding protein